MFTCEGWCIFEHILYMHEDLKSSSILWGLHVCAALLKATMCRAYDHAFLESVLKNMEILFRQALMFFAKVGFLFIN